MKPIRLKVRFVDGEKIRKEHAVFVGGGHHLVYPWVPAGELWLEKMKDPAAHRFMFAHEIIEICFMEWQGWAYQKAHNLANSYEQKLRKGASAGAVFACAIRKAAPSQTTDWYAVTTKRTLAVYRAI